VGELERCQLAVRSNERYGTHVDQEVLDGETRLGVILDLNPVFVLVTMHTSATATQATHKTYL
jgi:hypothetical protein